MTPTVVFHVRVFALAEKYFIKGLGDLAADAFASAAMTGSVEDLSLAISEAYGKTLDPDKVLRPTIVSHVLQHRYRLLKTGESAFDRVMEETPAFAADLVRAMARKSNKWYTKKEDKWYKCPDGCRTRFRAALHEDEDFSMFCDRLYRKSGKEWETYVTTEPT